jgi:acyl carrier protein
VNRAADLALRAAVLRVIASIHPSACHGQVDEQTTFTDLGFDSLDRITLAVAVEHTTGRHVPDEALPGLRTASDLLTHLTCQGART